MSNVTLELKGLKEAVEFYKKGLLLDTYVPEVNLAILALHNTIEKRIKESFYAPGSLDSVLVKESLNPFFKSSTQLIYGLEYEKKSIPLEEYPYSIKELEVKNAIPYTKGSSDKVYYLPINKARSVTVKVNKRGSAVKSSRVRTKYKKFLVEGKGIFVRKHKNTWTTFPKMEDGKLIGGDRAPIQRLYGYPLATLADTMFEHDPYIRTATEKVTDSLIQAMSKYYDDSK